MGSEGEMGCDNGEGAIRRLGSGVFAAGVAFVAGGARAGADSWRDCDRLDRPMLRMNIRTDGLFDACEDVVLPELPCLSWPWL